MTIWFFVLLIFAVALVAGPIAMLVPKPAQRSKEALRVHAMAQGVRFGMRKPPKLSTSMEEPRPSPVYYLPPVARAGAAPDWVLVRTDYVHEGNFYQEWDWQGVNRPSVQVQSLLREELPKLPATVIALSEGEAGTCVFWSERGGTQVLDLLIALLKAIQSPVSPMDAQ